MRKEKVEEKRGKKLIEKGGGRRKSDQRERGEERKRISKRVEGEMIGKRGVRRKKESSIRATVDLESKKRKKIQDRKLDTN